jgi:DegV family protein with EDD domain
MEQRKQYNIQVVPFYVSFDGELYQKEIDEIGIREVYERMVAEPTVYPKTSLPTVQNYIDAFTPHVREGRGVICMTITHTLSGSFNAAVTAQRTLQEEYPDAKITVINSYSATVTLGLHVIEAARMQQAGYSYEKNVAVLEGQMRDLGRIFFTVGDLAYLQHGGRIGKLAGMAGSVLRLKPMITLRDSAIESSGVARSRKKSMIKTLELLSGYFRDTGENPANFRYAVGFGYDEQEGREYLVDVNRCLAGLGADEQASLVQIGATICVHTGPYALGLGLIKKYDSISE